MAEAAGGVHQGGQGARESRERGLIRILLITLLFDFQETPKY